MNFRKNGDKYLITVEVLALIVVLVLGVLHFIMPGDVREKKIGNNNSIAKDATEDATQSVNDDTSVDADVTVAPFTPTDSVKSKIDSMTTEQKVAQLFITRPEEITGVSTFTQAGKKTKSALEEYPIGGLIFRQENFLGEESTKIMMSNLQAYAQEKNGVNMFLAVDEEGGDRAPLANGHAYEVQPVPSTLGSADAAGKSASTIASYMTKNGLNMNLSPTPLRTGGTCHLLQGVLAVTQGRVAMYAGLSVICHRLLTASFPA